MGREMEGRVPTPEERTRPPRGRGLTIQSPAPTRDTGKHRRPHSSPQWDEGCDTNVRHQWDEGWSSCIPRKMRSGL